MLRLVGRRPLAGCRGSTNVRVEPLAVCCGAANLVFATRKIAVANFASSWKTFHNSRGAFVHDRRRDSVMIAAGLRVLRLTWRQITRERDRTLAQLAQALITRPG